MIDSNPVSYLINMVVNPYMESPLAISSTGFGIEEDVTCVSTDQDNDVVSRHFKIQISEPEDIEKIKMPVVHMTLKKPKKHLPP